MRMVADVDRSMDLLDEGRPKAALGIWSGLHRDHPGVVVDATRLLAFWRRIREPGSGASPDAVAGFTRDWADEIARAASSTPVPIIPGSNQGRGDVPGGSIPVNGPLTSASDPSASSDADVSSKAPVQVDWRSVPANDLRGMIAVVCYGRVMRMSTLGTVVGRIDVDGTDVIMRPLDTSVGEDAYLPLGSTGGAGDVIRLDDCVLTMEVWTGVPVGVDVRIHIVPDPVDSGDDDSGMMAPSDPGALADAIETDGGGDPEALADAILRSTGGDGPDVDDSGEDGGGPDPVGTIPGSGHVHGSIRGSGTDVMAMLRGLAAERGVPARLVSEGDVSDVDGAMPGWQVDAVTGRGILGVVVTGPATRGLLNGVILWPDGRSFPMGDGVDVWRVVLV